MITDMSSEEHDLICRLKGSAFNVDCGMSAFFQKEFVVRHKYIALIFEGDFRNGQLEKYAYNVSKACEIHKYEKVVCFDIDQNIDASFLTDTSELSLDAIHNTFVMPSYCIAERFERFIIVSDSDYYWAIAGQEAFVQSVCRIPILDQLNRIQASAAIFSNSQSSLLARLGRNMLTYLDVCNEVFAEL